MGVFVSLVCVLFVAGCLAQTPAERATVAVTQLQRWFEADKGVWSGVGWWNSANSLTALAHYERYLNYSTFMMDIEDVYDGNERKQFLNSYYDDEGWWAMAMLDVYDLNQQEKYLDMAQVIFTDMTKAWDNTCGGGLWWNHDRKYKNAIPNELFLAIATRLYIITKQASYLTWAQEEWKWFLSTGMINARYLVNDGTANCKNNNGTAWTYNQGVILRGLVDLYKITGDPSYVTEAQKIANATIQYLTTSGGILQESCEMTKNCNGDQMQFKGIFVRHLSYLHVETQGTPLHLSSYATWIQHNADSIWNTDRSGTEFGVYWSGPFSGSNATLQTSVLDVFNAVVFMSGQ
eukprot:TRINITY_DN5715_c0_g1_i4.p1 TRINITY_DN5715_c0_g1~~TRINITY_DN5715_c0_g1_i4.p1  ORF type:complete len:348 (-),score=66.60 TRINITY_DN5715_c0_g1_i4:39-1082(-)